MSHLERFSDKIQMGACNKEREEPKNDGSSGNIEGFVNVNNTENNFEVLSSDSDEETVEDPSQGYVSLAQNEDDAVINYDIAQHEEISCPEEQEDDVSQLHGDHSHCDEASPSVSFSSTQNIQMGQDQINLIKSVMSNIQLPSSAIPEWAKKIPEEKWKQPLVSTFRHRTQNLGENLGNSSNNSSTS